MSRCTNIHWIWIGFLSIHFLICSANFSCSGQISYHIDPGTPKALQKLFEYSNNGVFFLSAHRGGPEPGFPENCIKTFENTLNHSYSMLECDPRYTKDSIIILHHDPTLDRTTTGHGKVSDFTFEEIKNLYLKDIQGNKTPLKITTLDSALEWSKGKTILVLDKKDVPIEERVKKITEHNAEASAIVIAYNYEEAKRCYLLNKNIVMEIFISSPDKIKEFEKFGVPWKNVVVFVGHEEPENPELFDLIHQKGALCIQGTSRNLDRKYTKREVSGIEDLRNEDKNWERKFKIQAAMITRMDKDVGRIVDLLKELAIDDNTIIFFTSDNGAHGSGGTLDFFKASGPLRGRKRDLYEGGIRAPMIVRWPNKIEAGSVSDYVGAFWDIMPTLADITGTEAPGEIDGISFLPELLGKKQPGHHHLYWEFYEQDGKQAVRKGKWKAVRLNLHDDFYGAPVELYNLDDDISESNNVADQYPDIVEDMLGLMKASHCPSDFFKYRSQ